MTRDPEERIQELLEANNRYQALYREFKQKPRVLFHRQKMIFRTDLIRSSKDIFVFGDNGDRLGYGGQAGEMRGEPNAHGISTKPSLPGFMDDLVPSHWILLMSDLHSLEIRLWLQRPERLVIPQDGLGTGLARMNETAPLMFEFMNKQLLLLEQCYGRTA